MAMRSLLFVPGDDERKIAKGLAGAADALILDLEDSVAPTRKPVARDLCARMLAARAPGKALYVRINALDTQAALEDLAAVVRARPDGIVLPKCRSAADVALLDHYLAALEARDSLPRGAIGILPIVTETAAAMFGLGTYAAHPRLRGMLWGGEDLAADVGALANRDTAGHYTPPFQLARSLCLFAAAMAGVDAIDAVYTDFRDAAGLAAEAAESQRSGFVAKAAIHPDQVAPINAAFTPSPESVAWAKRVVAAFDANPGVGVVAIDGRMIDGPHYRSAQRVLARMT